MAQATDPICGMQVDTESALSLTQDGETHFFCCAGCREKFATTSLPQRHTCCHDKPPQLHTVTTKKDDGRLYTCPMHPEVEQIGPGSCPKCGMDLEPKTVSLDEEDDGTAADMTRRFWVGLSLSVPLLVIDDGPDGRDSPWIIGYRLRAPVGFNYCLPRQWSCGAVGRCWFVAGNRWCIAVPTCLR